MGRRLAYGLGSVIAALLALGALLTAAPTVHACSRVTPPDTLFVVDPELQATDQAAPAPLAFLSASAHRVAGTVCTSAGTCTESSCGGSASILVEHDSQNAIADRELGFRIHLVEGSLPESMDTTVGSTYILTERLVFNADFDEVAMLHATITITVVDRAGNESSPSAPVVLRWSGCTEDFDGECIDETRFNCLSSECYEISGPPLACTVGSNIGRTRPLGALVGGHLGLFGLVAGRRLRSRTRLRR